MPTEAQYTREFNKRFRAAYPDAVVVKINDASTSGILDEVITKDGRSLWIEFKRDRPKLTTLQYTTLYKLDMASDGRAVVVVFKPGRRIDLYDCDYQVRGALRENLSWDEATTALLRILAEGQAFQ